MVQSVEIQDRKKFLFTAITLTASLAVSLLLATAVLEAYLRIKVVWTNRRAIRLSREMFIDKGILGYRMLPNSKGLDQEREISFIIETNSNGLRDIDYDYDIPKGRRRIIVVGDSFTFGYGVDNQYTYPKVLERELNKYGRAEVINAGMLSNSLAQDMHCLKEALQHYRADIALLGLHGGDVVESVGSEEGSGGRDEMKSGAHVNTDKKKKPPAGKPPLITFKDFLRYNLLSYGFIADKMKRNNFLSRAGMRLGLIENLDISVGLSDEFRDKETLDLLAGYLNGYSGLCKKEGIVPAMFYVPDRWHVAPQRFYSRANIVLEDINSVLRKMCGERGIAFLEISEELKGYPDADRELYFDYDYHFNRKGNEAVGKALCRAFLDRGLLNRVE